LSTAPYSFLVRNFHSLLHTGLARRTNIPNSHANRGVARFWDYVWDGLVTTVVT